MKTKRVAISLLLLSLLSLACVLTSWVPTPLPLPTPTPTFDRGILDPASGHHYFILPSVEWYTAVTYCSALKGHLVIINDAVEDNFVYTHLFLSNQTILLGATDQGHEGEWVWASGEKMEYANWSEGEPDNCGDLATKGECTPENFLSYDPDNPGKWDDIFLEGAGNFICEFEN